MMRRLSAALAMLAVSGSIALAIGQRQSRFPHEQHANLFPLCEGCHAGINTGESNRVYPEPALCGRCHDGTRAPVIQWTGPSRPPSNLTFSHVEHAASTTASGDNLDCAGCHGTGQAERMSVSGPDPALCGQCHAHASDQHFERGRDCATCHLPLAEATSLPQGRIEAFPSPPWHDSAGFAFDHAPLSAGDIVSCATCHARQTCTRCHFNEPPAVAQLAPDARVAAIEAGKPAAYPVPPSHESPAWSWGHAADASAGITSCANCHARNSCTVCHTESTVAALPATSPGDARGVQLDNRNIRVHNAGWTRLHATEAASTESCQSCHSTAFCEQCHTAATAPSFHGPDFMARHAPDAYAQGSDCASCHNPEVFCRGCHTGLGMGSQGRLGVAFHTSNPFWLVGHGVAARQGLEACASCHSQSTCMQCHSALGSWRINPHGPGFNASRLGDANRITCLLCHRSGAGG
jgi:hypothetical protein